MISDDIMFKPVSVDGNYAVTLWLIKAMHFYTPFFYTVSSTIVIALNIPLSTLYCN